jgi:glycine oxidase
VEYVTRGTIYPLSRTPDESEARQWALGEEFRAEVLDAKEVHAREPALSPRIRGGIFVKGDHWVNNQRLVMAYAQAAVASGVELRTGCLASRLVVEGSRVRGVVADGERLDADQVLVTAGAWTADLLASIGLALPLEPRRGQMLALAHVPPVLTHCVHGEVYLVPRPSGELLVGATVERAGFQRAVTVDGLSGLLRGALDLVPDLAELSIARTWAGLRPWAVDALPVLGPWPGADGLWLATAHFRNGILLAPITARVMTEWMVQGRPPLDVEEFLPDRFQRGGPR